MNKHHIISLSAAALSLCAAIGCDAAEADVLVDEMQADDSSSSDDGADPETSLDSGETTGDQPREPRLPATSTAGATDEASSTDAPDAPDAPDASDTDSGLDEPPDPFCGDGEIEPGVEACDDGDEGNKLEIGACAPDCSRVIEQKTITVAELIISGGDLGPQPVAFADAHCELGSLAMLSYPGVRQATIFALHDVGSIDWVIQPFTAYENAEGELLWITGPIPLLGVRPGQQHPLHAAIAEASSTDTSQTPVITGLVDGWVTSSDNTCAGWQSIAPAYQARVGRPDKPDALLDTGTPSACDRQFSVYCVEQ